MQHTHIGLLLQRELGNKGTRLLQTVFPIGGIGDTSWNLVSIVQLGRQEGMSPTRRIDRLRGVVLIENDCVFWLDPSESIFRPATSLVNLSVSSSTQQQSRERKRLWRDHDDQRLAFESAECLGNRRFDHSAKHLPLCTLESNGYLGQSRQQTPQPSRVLRSAAGAFRSRRPSTSIRHGIRRRDVATTRWKQIRATTRAERRRLGVVGNNAWKTVHGRAVNTNDHDGGV